MNDLVRSFPVDCSASERSLASTGNHFFLSCIVSNARSLKNKLHDLHYMLYIQSPDIIFFTETWLQEFFPDSLLDPKNNYNILRHDRSYSRGGGVCIFISKRLTFVPLVIENDVNLEMIAVDIIADRIKCRFVNVYRKPSYATEDVHYAQNVINRLQKLCDVKYSTVIVGDINCPLINWPSLTCPSDGIQDIIMDFICDNGFEQLVVEPTRGNNILDVVMSNNCFLVSDIQLAPPLGNSDHSCVKFTVDLPVKNTFSETSSQKVYLWNQADYELLSNYLLQINWSDFLSVNLTVDSIWTSFKSILFDAFDQFVPTRRRRGSGHTKKNHYPRAVRRAFSRKRTLWRLHKSQPNNNNLKRRYRQAEVSCRRLLREHELESEKKILESGDTGMFYKHVNKKLLCSSGIGSLSGRNGEPVVDNTVKANLLNEYFSSMCTEDNGIQPPFERQVPADVSIDRIVFDSQNVYKVMRQLKSKTSFGPDGIPSVVLKKLSSSLASPLAMIFEAFMSVGQVPDEWRSAVVTPLFKKGLPTQCANYRPVSLTCVICKVMEKIIVSQLTEYLRTHQVISAQQHGFFSRRSTVTNLLETLNDWTVAIRDNNRISTVYIDYSKAFDSVSHPKLFQKLAAFGITGSLFTWITQFLTDRKQVTRVGESLSCATFLKSGIVQGSCLGPLLFLLYVNDVTVSIGSSVTCKLYADDIKLYSVVNTADDRRTLQDSLDRLKEWSDTWQLQISTTKCVNMNTTRSDNVDNSPFTLGNNALAIATSVKDLGVTVTCNLKFDQHINNIVGQARRRAGLLFKCFITRDAEILSRAFKVYIRPLLEYASSVWSPVQVGLIDKIESVQRRYTKRIDGLELLTYPERLSVLNLESLELRRLHADLITAYKLIFGLSDSHSEFFVVRENSTTRGHPYKIMPEHCHINIRKYFFSQRVTKIWNSLPAASINFTDLKAFRSSLHRIDLRGFTRY